MVQEPRAWSLRNLGGDDGARVVLTGEIDLDAAPEVTQELRAASQQFALPLLLDLGDVTLMDSVGLRVLLLAWQEANAAGSVITIVQASPPVRRMLEWTGTAPLFAIDLRPLVVGRVARPTPSASWVASLFYYWCRSMAPTGRLRHEAAVRGRNSWWSASCAPWLAPAGGDERSTPGRA